MNNTTSTNSILSVEEFLINLKMTKGIRYLIYFRLEKKDRLDSIIVAVLSFLVITSSLFEWHLRTHNISTDWFTFLTIVSSIFILVISQYEDGKGYRVRAQIFHRSALDIEMLEKHLESLISCNAISPELLEQFSNDYIQILHETPEPHEPVDYAHFKFRHPRSYPTRYNTDTKWKWIHVHICGRFVYYWDVYFWPFLLITIPTIIFFILIYKSPLKILGGF